MMVLNESITLDFCRGELTPRVPIVRHYSRPDTLSRDLAISNIDILSEESRPHTNKPIEICVNWWHVP